jgi:hypothetical protein
LSTKRRYRVLLLGLIAATALLAGFGGTARATRPGDATTTGLANDGCYYDAVGVRLGCLVVMDGELVFRMDATGQRYRVVIGADGQPRLDPIAGEQASEHDFAVGCYHDTNGKGLSLYFDGDTWYVATTKQWMTIADYEAAFGGLGRVTVDRVTCKPGHYVNHGQSLQFDGTDWYVYTNGEWKPFPQQDVKQVPPGHGKTGDDGELSELRELQWDTWKLCTDIYLNAIVLGNPNSQTLDQACPIPGTPENPWWDE